MSIWDITVWILAVCPVLYRAWEGWQNGATTEMRHVIANLVALLVALKYWQVATESIAGSGSFAPRWAALCAFVILYGLAFAVAGFAVKIRGQIFRSVDPNPVNSILGLLAGIFSGSLLGGALVLLLGLAAPVQAGEDSPIGAVRNWPLTVLRFVESDIAGVPSDAPGRVLFPQVDLVNVPAGVANPDEGTILTKVEPQLTGWN